MYILAAIY